MIPPKFKTLAYGVIFTCAALLLGKTASAQNAGPAIIRASWKVAPGQAVGVYGWNLGTSTATTLVAIQPLSSGALDPATARYQLSLVNVQSNLAQGILPANVPGDLYAAWVNNSSGWSNPVFINRAEVFWVSEGQVYPGQSLRLFGRNFSNPTVGSISGVQVNVVGLNGGATLPATVTQATDNTIDITVPQGVQPGTAYTVQVTNGAGGTSGWVQMEDQLSFTAVAASPNLLAVNAMFNLNAAWVGDIPLNQTFNVKDYGAVGDGVTEDFAALQKTFNAARKAGGIVNIPAGIYLSSATLTISSDTVLVGAGPDQTQLVYDNKTAATWGNQFLSSAGQEVGLVNLSVINPIQRPASLNGIHNAGFVGLVHFGNNFSQPAQPGIFFENVVLKNIDGGAIGHGYSPADVIIENSTIVISENAMTLYTPNSHVRIRNNTMTNTVRDVLNINSITGANPSSTPPFPPPTYSWLEGNTFNGSGCLSNPNQVGCIGGTGVDEGEHRMMDEDSSFLYFGNNKTTGEFGGSTNDGEGITFQGTVRLAYGRAGSATSNTLTDPTQAFAANGLANALVTVIGGTGAGQMRTVTTNTASQMTITTPWQVVPDATSIYTIDPYVAYHNIFVDNNMQAIQTSAAIDLYTKSYDNIVARNMIANSGGIITNANEVPTQKRADFAYFNYVADNQMVGAGNPVAVNGGANYAVMGILSAGYQGDVLHGTVVYGAEFRSNRMVGVGTTVASLCPSGKGCTFLAYSGIDFSEVGAPLSYPFAQGAIVEKNNVSNTVAGIHLFSTAYDTLLMDNTFNGNGTAIDDHSSVRTIMYTTVISSPTPPTPPEPPTTTPPTSSNPSSVIPATSVRVYPNPWRQDRHSGYPITFDGLAQGSTVKIFTISGHQVIELNSSNAVLAAWNLNDSSGVASGIYLYLIESNNGPTTKGKLAVIR